MTHYLHMTRYNSSSATVSTRFEIAASRLYESSRNGLTKPRWTHPRNLPTFALPEPTALEIPCHVDPCRAPGTCPNVAVCSQNFVLESEPVLTAPSSYLRHTFSDLLTDYSDDHDSVVMPDDDAASNQSWSKASVSSYSATCSMCFDSGCGSTPSDNELAKRCQQCREIIIAAKEKQEGEARKNANCLLEQIEQEEEERANREAMQARKRERKRMKRKAKQEKDRQGKEEFPQPSYSTTSHQRPVTGNDEEDEDDDNEGCGSGLLLQRVADAAGASDNDFGDEIGIPTLRQAMQHLPRQEAKAVAQCETSLSLTSPTTALDPPFSSELQSSKNTPKSNSLQSSVNDSVNIQVDFVSSDHKTQQDISSPTLFTSNEDTTPTTISASSQAVGASAATEAKREKHRSKKQSQRAAKRAAAFIGEPSTPVFGAPSSPSLTREASSASPSYYANSHVGASGDSEVNWNAFIESTQNAQLGHYISPTCLVVSSSESSTWTTVLPSSSSRTQRANASGSSSSRTFQDTSADWKTSGSTSGSFRRRISIPVSRHDIGKVIGQGGAVVSALRNMSGIQIDIESARSDEVTERMVYLKGPGDAVQRTYETIQGLLNGSIAGNDVLLMYAALKKSTTTASLTFGRTFLGALNSKAAITGATTLIVPSGATKTTTSTGRSGAATKSGRRKASTTATPTNTTISISSTRTTPQSSSLIMLNRTASVTVASRVGLPMVATVASHNNNNSSSSTSCSITTGVTTLLTSTSPPIMAAKLSAPSWSAKLPNGSSRANFASVAAAGLATQPGRSSSKAGESFTIGGGSVQTSSAPKYVGVPSLMSTITPTTTTAPVSLLSLNVTPLTTNSQMFPDLALSLSNNAESVPPDSMDEISFPPLNPTAKSSRPVPVVAPSTTDENKTPTSQSPLNLTGQNSIKNETTNSTVSHKHGCATSEFNTESTAQVSELPGASVVMEEVTTTVPCSPASIFKPLSISPPTVTASTQALTPSVSVGNHSFTNAGTPPVTVTQTRPFARAPGSERSAHQRNVNISATPNTVTANEKYPPSLMSLDIALACPSVDVPDDSMLLTPTKRAVSPEKSGQKVNSGICIMPYVPGQSGEWQHSDSITPVNTGSETGQVFPKTIKFSSNAENVSDIAASVTTTSVHQSVLASSNSSTLGSNAAAPGKSLLRPSNDSYHSLMCPPAWSMQPPTDLNPNAAAFQPSAFQTPIAVTNSAYQHYQQTASASGLTNNPGASLESQATGTSGTLSNIRPDYTGSDSLRLQLEGSSAVASRHQSIRPSPVPPSITLSCSSNTTVPGSMMVTTNAKQMLPVNHNAYLEPRLSALNGFHSNNPSLQQQQQQHIQNPASSLMTSATPQFHTYFSGQSVTQQQQPNTSGSTISNRLGGGSSSPHSLLNTSAAQLAGPYVNAPPYFMQSQQQQQQSHTLGTPVVNSSQQQPDANAFSASFINGTANQPSMSVLTGLSSGGVHPAAVTAQPPPPVIQPIGAERRRQAATGSSVQPPPPTGLAYPSGSMANGMTYGLHGSQQQSQQAPNNATTTNNLLMAFTMNLMQQQQQQQQHQQQHLPHSTTAWQQSSSQWSQAGSAGGAGNKPPSDLAAYCNTAASLLSVGGGTPSSTQQQQQQQTMINAAMAAMASMYPWGGNAPTSLGPPGSASGTNSALPSNRWLYPPSQVVPPTSSAAFYSDRPPPLSMKSTHPSSTASSSAAAAAATQPLHRPAHD